MLGLLVGDALGVPYEFKSPSELPSRAQIEFSPPLAFQRSHPRVVAGTWSDDGAQALCLLASLLRHDRFDANDFAQRLVDWYEHGYMAVEGKVFDVGIQTARALRAIRQGAAPLDAARCDEQGNGNGALMRVLPLALWHRRTECELVADARASSAVTHGHLRSQLCCGLYCLWVRRILRGDAEPWLGATNALRSIIGDEPAAVAELELHIRPDLAPEHKGSGYVVDTLRSARMLMAGGDYEEVVKSAVLLGYDTDTTAAVAGGVAGVRDGVEAIPRRWREALRGHELVEPLLALLVARAPH